MDKTPPSGEGSLKPVHLLPVTPTSADKSNFAVVKARVEELTQELLSNYIKLQSAQTLGLKLCYAIEALKTKRLENGEVYFKELKSYCKKLAMLVSDFDKAATHAQKALKQLLALRKMSGVDDKILHRTWKLSQYINCVQTLAECYKQEALVKGNVMKLMAHCETRIELVKLTSQWEYPQFFDDFVRLCFACLKEEFKKK